MPREKNYDETDVLERATRAFWARGYEGTSMSDLVEATGLHRGSIYAAYTNKRNLFMESLRHFDKAHGAGFFGGIAQKHDAKGAIIAAFEGAAQQAERGDTPGGCLIVNTALELSPHDPDIRDFVDACLLEVEDFFYSQINAAKRSGTIKKAIPSRETAQALLGLFLGLRVLTRTGPRRSATDAITRQVRMMVE